MPESYFGGVFTISSWCSGGRVIVCHTRAQRCALSSRRRLGSLSLAEADTDSVRPLGCPDD